MKVSTFQEYRATLTPDQDKADERIIALGSAFKQRGLNLEPVVVKGLIAWGEESLRDREELERRNQFQTAAEIAERRKTELYDQGIPFKSKPLTGNKELSEKTLKEAVDKFTDAVKKIKNLGWYDGGPLKPPDPAL